MERQNASGLVRPVRQTCGVSVARVDSILHEHLGVLSEPNVKTLAASTMLKAPGNNVYVIVLAWLAYDLTGSPLAVGFVAGLHFIPIMFMGVISGAVSDRVHRPTVRRAYALWYTALSFGFTSLLYWGQVDLVHILGYMFLLGLAFTFGPKARRVIYGSSVRKDRVVSALALEGAVFSLGHLTMPVIVTFVLTAHGAVAAFALQCALYSEMTALAFNVKLPRIQTEGSQRPSFLKSVVEGIAYARGQTGIRRVLLISYLAALFGDNFVFALVSIVSRDIFDAGAAGVGVIVAGRAVGGIIGPGMLVVTRRPVDTLGALINNIDSLVTRVFGLVLRREGG